MNKQINKTVKVTLPIPKGYWYDYLVPENLEIKRGNIVKVPFGSRKLIGIVLGEGEGKFPLNKLKSIIESYDYTFEEELNFTIMRNVFETKLDRALGFKGTAQKNERIVLQSQFQESRNIQDSDGQMKEGFFKRLLGRR